METPKILVLAGSLRKGSYNKMLARVAAKAAERAGARVTLIDLADFPLPVYDGDLEAAQGLPENARRLRALMIEHDGFLIATPEYNSGIPGPFKNALDWASRGENGKGDLTPYTRKAAGLMSASPGAMGASRAVAALRMVLSNIGVLVIPEQTSVPKAHEAFGEDGRLLDPARLASVEKEAACLVGLLKALIIPRPKAARSKDAAPARRRRSPTRRGTLSRGNTPARPGA